MSKNVSSWGIHYTHPVRPIPEPMKQQKVTSEVLVLKLLVVMALTGIACGFWMVHQAEKAVACQAVGL